LGAAGVDQATVEGIEFASGFFGEGFGTGAIADGEADICGAKAEAAGDLFGGNIAIAQSVNFLQLLGVHGLLANLR
jgi:hypothetical protein